MFLSQSGSEQMIKLLYMQKVCKIVSHDME